MVRGSHTGAPGAHQWRSSASRALPRLTFGDQRAGTLAGARLDLLQGPTAFVPDHEANSGRDLRVLTRLDADAAPAHFPGEERFAVFLFEQLGRGEDKGRPLADRLAVVA